MKLSPRAALRLCTYLPFLVACVFAIPLTDNQTFFEPGSAQTDSAGNVQPRQSTDKPFYLRIQPLGASITYGYGTNPENGYRRPLRDQLRWRGWPINMVGSQSSGDPVNFKDRQHEGHKGWYVANMTMAANLSLDQKPNLILINCGTNDANPDNHQDVARTGARMKAVLNHLYDSVDGVTIILSTLVPYKQEEANDNVDLINVQYRSLVERLSGEGRKIVLAEMNNGFLDTSTDYFDAIHPNEKGAAKMAAVWDQAILIAEEQGFLTAPIDTDVPDTSTSRCDVEKGQARGPVQTQQGWGYSDGEYKHRETRTGPIAPTQSYSSDHFPEVYFAQLVNAGGADPPFAQDELILCYDNDADFDGPPSTCTMQLNDGSGDFNYSPKIYLELGLDCLTRGIRWGDVNGDGLDDFICINQAGNMYVAINRGDNPPRFEALENGGLIREGYSWAKQDRIRLGDIDGDGRLDYCALDDTGDIFCWRNGGVGDAPTDRYNGYWQSIVCVLSHSLLYLSFFLFLSFFMLCSLTVLGGKQQHFSFSTRRKRDRGCQPRRHQRRRQSRLGLSVPWRLVPDLHQPARRPRP
jgi:lysophospholipase L1-like esterase